MNRPQRTFPTSRSHEGRASSDAGGSQEGAVSRDWSRAAVIGLFVLALLVALHAAAALVVPMAAAVILGSVLAHVGDRAQRVGIPPIAAGMGLVAATGVGLFLLGNGLAEALGAIVERAPEMTKRIDGLLDRLLAPVAGLESRLVAGGSIFDGSRVEGGIGRLASSIDMPAVTGFLGGLTPAFGEVLIFLATLVFFVAGRATMRRRLILSFGDRDRRLAAIRIFNAAETALATFFGTTAAIYLGLALATAAIAWSSGLANPALWGVVTFLMSFVPFLGPAIVTFALVSAGLLAHDGILAALWPATGFLAVHLVCENAVIPSILGRRFEINPFLVFVAIVFWTWMWGPMGAVLAVPLMLIARTVHEELLGPEIGSLPE